MLKGSISACQGRLSRRTELRVAAAHSLPYGPKPLACSPRRPALLRRPAQGVRRLGEEDADSLTCRAASAAGASSPPSDSNKSSSPLPWILLALGAAAAAAYFVSAPGQALKEVLFNGPLGKSGFLAAFSLIFVSEIGDKTFFIAALLAMRIGRWMSFFGSVSALSVMTVISVSIGAVCSRVPDALKSSIPVGELAGIALLVFFGVKTLRAGLAPADDGASSSDEELADAETVVQGVDGGKAGGQRSRLAVFIEVATLIFLAEWGD
ncbi:GDT1-like protein 2, chloroplastic, partial [Tetrabaena socialis]